jgi:hypothetical protein
MDEWPFVSVKIMCCSVPVCVVVVERSKSRRGASLMSRFSFDAFIKVFDYQSV